MKIDRGEEILKNYAFFEHQERFKGENEKLEKWKLVFPLLQKAEKMELKLLSKSN